MSEEEKEAIKELIDSSNLSLIGDGTMIVKNTTIATALNLIDKLQKRHKELIEANDKLKSTKRIKTYNDIKKCFISKEKIRKFIKEELPDDEIMECCETYDSNGVYLRKKLEEILEENE